ncbi:MAG TPA: YncE family protein [Acidobacteriaceae bacterium]|jgi:DNA-binding beta-propeller fold protein YncE
MPRTRLLFVSSCLIALTFITAHAQSQAPLRLAARLAMPSSVQGRFDHLGIDQKGGRLFVAAESAHQVLVFDLKSGKYLRSIEGIEIPHAIFVREDRNRIYVTDGGAGALKVYDGATYALLKTIPLKLDADSIGYDPATHFLYIDNGGGDAHESFSMLSVVDTTRDVKVADIKIDGDTLEAMALEKSTEKMYVNNPAKNQVDELNRKQRSLTASWPVTLGKKNVAMALDEAGQRLFVASRSGDISVFDTATGKETTSMPIGKGVDDLAFDPATKRVYAPCGGDGLIYVYEQSAKDKYSLVGKVASGPRGKNALLDKAAGRYFVIVPPQGETAGAVYAYALQ